MMDSSTEIVKLGPEWQESLQVFLQDLRDCGDDVFFSPHPIDGNTINRLANSETLDFYYLLVQDDSILGYGLLRGWDEGYKIPSLGMAIHPSARCSGLGKMFLNFLHTVALRKGAKKMRLRVLNKNQKAIGLYRSLGYVFEEDKNQDDYLIGFKNLGQ